MYVCEQDKLNGSSCLCLLSATGFSHPLPLPVFSVGAGIQTQVLLFVLQTLYQWRHSLSLALSVGFLFVLFHFNGGELNPGACARWGKHPSSEMHCPPAIAFLTHSQVALELTVQSKLPSPPSFCLHLLIAGVTGIDYHPRLLICCCISVLPKYSSFN